MGDYKYNFYVCHDETDDDVARNILKKLEENTALKGFYDDRDANAGKSTIQNIDDAICNSKYILVLFSDAAISNRWFETKVHASLNHRLENPALHNTIIPIYICAPSGERPSMPPTMSIFIGIEYEDERNFFSKLERTLQRR